MGAHALLPSREQASRTPLPHALVNGNRMWISLLNAVNVRRLLKSCWCSRGTCDDGSDDRRYRGGGAWVNNGR
jgi:hypothetical protein